MNSKQFAGMFPLGSHLCREPMPAMSELKRDMELLKREGFNLIKIQEHWQLDEPVEGAYDFSRTQELIERAAKLDLGVYLGLTCEQAPAWLWRKHPGCRMIGRDGRPVAYEAQSTLPADGKPGPCFDHPGARADMVRFIARLVQTLAPHENIVVWNTWQEIGYWSDWIVGQSVCFCEHTLAHFRRWLTERYGHLDALNRAWRTRYGTWDDVSPNRSLAGRGAFAVDVAWQQFMDNAQMAAVLQARCEAIRQADPKKRPIFAHKGGPAIGGGSDWTYARSQDFLGTSCYPAWMALQAWDDGRQGHGTPERHTALLAEAAMVALSLDYIRSSNERGRPLWAAEFQGGPVSTGLHKGRVPSPEDIRRWMLTAVASGATAISFWVSRAEIAVPEINGFSLLDSVGDSSPRFEEAGRIGRALNRHADLFAAPSLPAAPVAILVDEWSRQVCSVYAEAGDHLTYSVRGWHRLLWDAGVAVDFVEASQLDEPWARQYRAMILPFPIAMSDATAKQLKKYVEQGGTLVSCACPGRIEENVFAARGELSPTMQELLGVEHRSLGIVREPAGESRWTPRERTWGEFIEPTMLQGTGPLQGKQLRANFYLETLTCRGSEPCLMHGDQAAGTVRKVGQGHAWLIGTFIGHSGTAHADPQTNQAVLAILATAGVQPERRGPLLLRKRAAGAKEAWLLTNPTPTPVTAKLNVAGWKKVESLLGEALTRSGDQVSVTVPSLDVACLIVSQ